MSSELNQTKRVPKLLLLATHAAHGGCAAQSNNTTIGERAIEPVPIVIAHRGASGYRPEHTLAAYSTAALQGADYVELDLVSTRDGHLIARHDNVLDLTTDVAQRPEFTARRTEKTVDGRAVTGWFSEDFTLEEIRQLRAIERIPEIRPQNAEHDAVYPIPTLEEAISAIESLAGMLGRNIGLYIELKHPAYFDALGFTMEQTLTETLSTNGYSDPTDRVYLQSFEIESLKRLDRMTDLRLVQLLASSGQPYDIEVSGGDLSYADMRTPNGLREIAQYADGVGPDKDLIIPRSEAGELDAARVTNLVAQAHAAGLVVHPYTFRAENAFLPADLRSSADRAENGYLADEIASFLGAGIDGFFTDHTQPGLNARERFLRGLWPTDR